MTVIGIILIGASVAWIIYSSITIVRDVRKKKNDKKDGDTNK